MKLFKLILPLLILSLMLACSPKSTKPNVTPKPPLIDCKDRRPTDPLPSAPVVTDYRVWADYSQALLNYIGGLANRAADTADCYDKHRKAGDIR